MKQFIIESLFCALIAAIVFGLSKLFRCKVTDSGISQPRRSAIHALTAVAISISILFLLILPQLLASKPQPSTHHARTYSLIPQMILLVLYAIPAGIFMLRDKESLHSVGISKSNLWQAAIIGLLLSALALCSEPAAKLSRFSPATHSLALIYYSFVGFGEEFLFRGYLQTRLVAWLGVGQGWILASVIMALSHFPGRLLGGMSLLDTFISCASLISWSLLAGFVMLRVRNLLAPGIFHTFMDWISVLK